MYVLNNLNFKQNLQLLFGEFEGEKKTNLHKLSQSTLSCILSQLEYVNDLMETGTDLDIKKLKSKVITAANKAFFKGFFSPSYTKKEQELVSNCRQCFAKLLDMDMCMKLIGIQALDKHLDPVKCLSGSFIEVFDDIYDEFNEEN